MIDVCKMQSEPEVGRIIQDETISLPFEIDRNYEIIAISLLVNARRFKTRKTRDL